MNMFSMKPKFDLAAFLAVPAPVGARKPRGIRSRGMQFTPSTAPKTEAAPTATPDTKPAGDTTQD